MKNTGIMHELRVARHRLRVAHAWVVGKLRGRPPERIVWWSDDDREFEFLSDMSEDNYELYDFEEGEDT